MTATRTHSCDQSTQMTTAYQPHNRLTGDKGPSFEFMTLACLWVCYRANTAGWTVRQVVTE